MAGYTNGQNYYGLPNDKPPSHPLQYPGYPSQPAYEAHQARRPESFNPGDDATALNDRQFQDNHGSAAASGAMYPPYGSINNQTAQHGHAPQVNDQTNLPFRMPSRADPGPAYATQTRAAPQATGQPSYNPSQYPQPQPQPYYNSQIYGSPTSSYSSSTYQAYNPAAYQTADTQPYPTQFYGQPTNYENRAQGYMPAHAPVAEPPPLPPRHHDSSYSPQNLSYASYTEHAYHANNSNPSTSSGLPPQPAAYSPPAPPAPPHDANATGYGYSGPPRPYAHTPAHSSEVPNATGSRLPPAGWLSSESQPSYEDRQVPFASHVSPVVAAQSHASQPSLPSPYSQQPPPVMPHRAGTVGRHPQSRPLPGTPAQADLRTDNFGSHNGAQAAPARNHDGVGYDDLMREVDAAIHDGNDGSTPAGMNRQSFPANSRETISMAQGQATPLSASPRLPLSPDERPTHMNGELRPTEQYINYAAFSDTSDAEAAAGLAAMQAAEEQEAAEEARHRSDSISFHSSRNSYGDQASHRQQPEMNSDGDYANVDMGLVGGGYGATMPYGDEPQSDYAAAAALVPQEQPQHVNRQVESVRSSGPSSDGRSSYNSGYESIPAQDVIHPFPPFRHVDLARVDTGGTGGLTEPSPHRRRLSFEDGDEANMVDSEAGQTSESVSPSKDNVPDLFFFPDTNPQRPLPPAPSCSDPGRIPHLIPAGTFLSAQGSRREPNGRPYPSVPSSYAQLVLSPSPVPRSTSLANSRSAPRPEQPARSKTDADRAKILKQQFGGPDSDIYEPNLPGGNLLDMPTIPRKKFNPAKLTRDQLKKCHEPWALSSIVAWIQDLAEEETDLKEQAIVQAIIALFTFAVPTMNMADAEALADKVVEEMFSVDALVKEEEWVKFGNGTVSGVLFQLTKKGCYSWTLHEPETPGKCYSFHCMRTLRKVDLSLPTESEKNEEDWMTFYRLKMDNLSSRDKKEIERQNVLHEIVITEVAYIASLNIVRILYRDSLTQSQPPIIQSKRMTTFCRDVFGKVDDVKQVNENYLLAQLKYRQREQGPWISGFSDIFREWIRKAKLAYVAYATGFPLANFLMRKEAGKNILFKQFLDQARDDQRSNRLSWDTYLKSPITRLQRYGLLLSTVLKNTTKDSEEKMKLQFAIDEIKAATHECNAKVAEMEKKMELLELKDKLRLRRGMEKEVGLNLDHLGREMIWRGDLLRAGGKGFQWVDTHAILFDHYFVLAKAVASRDSSGGPKHGHYDVSKVPIPMDLIVLESTNDDPVVKGSVKSIGGISTMAATPRGATESRIGRTTSTLSGGSAPATLVSAALVTSSGSSLKDNNSTGKTMVTTTVLESNSKDDKIIYPFRVKHLGKSEIYTLYASSKTSRDEWCQAISSAKDSHAAALFKQNAEPFRLRVLADTAFGYDSLAGSYNPTVIKGTPLDRAINEVEQRYVGRSRPSPLCRATVNCATAFNHPPGRLMCAVGTDYGVYFSEYDNPRGWSRAIQMSRVVQVAVFEEFNLFLLIADKVLIAYHLDAVCPPSGVAPPTDASARRAPQKLSGNKDVGFFATGRMKDRALVFYKKKDGISSTFKVLEPILQKSGSTRSRFLPTPARRGQTDFFREFDEFYIPAECYGINLFHSSLAVATARGIEVLTLDKKQPWSVPALQSGQADAQAHLSSIAGRIKDLKPLGMFRLSEAEFLVAFEECAVYVNKHGDVSRGVVMEFVGKATTACLYGQHLILFVHDFVEIRNAMNGSLKQVIAGKDIKMLDDGGGSNSIRSTNGGLGGGMNGLGVQGYGAAPRTVKIGMQHPGHDRTVIVVELLQNEGARE